MGARSAPALGRSRKSPRKSRSRSRSRIMQLRAVGGAGTPPSICHDCLMQDGQSYKYAGEMKTVSFSPEEEQNPPNNRMCQGCVGRVTHALRRPAPLASARKRPTRTPPRRTMSQSQVPRPHKDVATKKRRRKRRRRKNTRHKR